MWNSTRLGEQFRQVADQQQLDEVFERSNQEPVLLFKHDLYCPISHRAYMEMNEVAGREIPWIDVADDQPISFAAADRTGVRHESPQVLLLRNGRAVWHASHGRVTADAVEAAIRENS